jgi:hypothetical protein
MPRLWSEKQKEKGVKLILHWWAGRNYWRKKIDGHTKYFRHPNSAEGYSAAVAEYHAYLQSHQLRNPIRLLTRRSSGWARSSGCCGNGRLSLSAIAPGDLFPPSLLPPNPLRAT